MDSRYCKGFVLPFALLIALSLLTTGMLFLEQGISAVSRGNHELARIRLEKALLALIPTLTDSLAAGLEDPATVTASKRIGHESGNRHRSLLLNEEWPAPAELSSHSDFPKDEILFSSLQGNAALPADLIDLVPSGQSSVLAVAWAMENLGLHENNPPIPDFWPLPGWDYGPTPGNPSTYVELLDIQTHGAWRQGPWINVEEALPLTYWRSPGLVPVVENLNLQLGIFASGPPRSREKVIRIRFYLGGSLWNPYNRPLRVHYGSARSASFRVIFWNLPEVRLHNKTLGVSSAWIPLDESENAWSGENGIHGWINLPSLIEAGEIVRFLEPDAKRQPEGLARTVHPAFPVSSGHRIEIEFRERPGGVYAACLALEERATLSAALEGKGWFRVEGFPVQIPNLHFDRAARQPRPFLLEGGSLSFRQENVHLALTMTWLALSGENRIDHRRRVLNFSGGQPGPGDGWMRDRDLVDVSANSLLDDSPADTHLQEGSGFRVPEFSWPANPPQNLLEATDIPEWRNAFRLGTQGASRLNALLNETYPWAPENSLVLNTSGNESLRFQKIIPVNTQSAAAWEEHLRSTAEENATSNEFSWASYALVNPSREEDFLGWTHMKTTLAAHRMAADIAGQPSLSVADFYNRGILENAFDAKTSLERLMPLRGWLRKAPPVAARGAAWILHLAATGSGENGPIWRTARAWLLETQRQPETPSLELIHFEWTAPADHLRDPSD